MDGFDYHLYRSKRSTLSIEISPEALVLVRAPQNLSLIEVEKFLHQKQAWILKHLNAAKQKINLPEILPEQKTIFAQTLLHRIHQMEKKLKDMGYCGPYPRIYRFNTAKKQWGNCRSNGVVTFNRYAYFLPDDLLWYLYVHELSHLREMNHGPHFWENVLALVPDFKEQRKRLKEYRIPR